MSELFIDIAGVHFSAKFEAEKAPQTCAAFRGHVPFESKVIHVRWSGEGMWIPLDNMNFNVGCEDPVSYPAPGHVLLHPHGVSETEILIAYGHVNFSSKAGQLAGTHFATITSDLDKLKEVGVSTLWEGAKPICFSIK